jgi:hypothetical protein
VDYHFVDERTFMALKDNGEFLEHAFVHGNWYATSATWLSHEVHAGHDVLLEIDWQGARQVRHLIPGSVLIFILPPSLESLRERLTKRGTGRAGRDRAPHGRRARRNAALRRVRLCYYESGLCEGRRRSVGDRARRPAGRVSTAGAARGPHRRLVEIVNGSARMARITIEDCLARIPNRFELTLAATNRARQITAGSAPDGGRRPRQAHR